MISLDKLKSIYLIASILLGIIILTPTLAFVAELPSAEKFSELWLLGQNHKIDAYPFNISQNSPRRIYLGIGNHLGQLAYYKILVKLRNQTEPLPQNTGNSPSPLPPLYEYHAFLPDTQVWEKDITFTFNGIQFEENVCIVATLLLNGNVITINKTSTFDQSNNGFFFQLFFELWLYDTSLSQFTYNERYVALWLNMTRNS